MLSYSFWTVSHLEKPTTHAKILVANFSLAFNLMQPRILAHKLVNDFNLANQLVAWIVDFLFCRCGCVFVNGKCAGVRLTHTRSPEGYCLTPSIHPVH